MAGQLPHTLRADAQDNRERILDAARAAFAADGLNAPIREIARRAGVSPATVYRRFPTKTDLAHAVYLDQSRTCQAIVHEGLADPDPWAGFRLVIEKVFDLHARDRGFPAAFMSAFPDAMDFAADRRASLEAVAELARRAQATGELRSDFTLNDLVLVMVAHRGLRAGTTDARLAASRRFATLAIQAFQST
ncbi:TetR/AcrR family transcriptional regulator [Solirubrobacter phytolaccae]|uniref:TetR/AcrR family transcriptional regulator n=1 Tax=Solirubrobacter phytolaccae TaxID=1404360 RepID=A0A9X3N524_9ACTN|nr:TetR/AcrR family transcriptional regulator [Solirubrobacter phytolaccae]MDA0179818.1 TetR/AcrR family transcriptional regulator [Solirubrobacter phytolaccae]